MCVPAVLGQEHTEGGAAAVAKGVGKALQPSGRRISGDNTGSKGVYRALDQQFTDVQVGLVQGGDKAVPAGAFQQGQVRYHVLPGKYKLWRLTPHVDQAEDSGEQLGD